LGYVRTEYREYIVQRGQVERGRIAICVSAVQASRMGWFAHPK